MNVREISGVILRLWGWERGCDWDLWVDDDSNGKKKNGWIIDRSLNWFIFMTCESCDTNYVGL